MDLVRIKASRLNVDDTPARGKIWRGAEDLHPNTSMSHGFQDQSRTLAELTPRDLTVTKLTRQNKRTFNQVV